MERSDAERAGSAGGEAMTSPVSRPRAHLSVDDESGGLRAMRCMWQPMGQDDLACDMERNARRPRRAPTASLNCLGGSRITAKSVCSMGRSESPAAGGRAGHALHVGVGSLLYVLGRQSLGPALPSWRGLQACGSSSLATAVAKVAPTGAYPQQRSLQLSPGRKPYTGQPPK